MEPIPGSSSLEVGVEYQPAKGINLSMTYKDEHFCSLHMSFDGFDANLGELEVTLDSQVYNDDLPRGYDLIMRCEGNNDANSGKSYWLSVNYQNDGQVIAQITS